MAMADVRAHREFNHLRIELLGGRRPADTAGIFLARVIGDGLPLRRRTAGDQLAQPFGELATSRSSIARAALTARSRAVVGKALSLGLLRAASSTKLWRS
jgi:hypothetical protein